ncbi:MAG: quinolinate synthase NadA [Pleurocapsa minor GSE-CHR-MK-17-07R]|nr:quinolinate synthase NadA [Pleurocapsa minor GSE-CHR-MK 17-07R]
MTSAPVLIDEVPVQGEDTLIDAEAAAVERIRRAREILGDQVVILGHHYQRDAVVQFADYAGDSYQLSRDGARVNAKYIIFAGVHFMAESAVILGRPDQVVILPNMNAGCSMADMANLEQVLTAWDELGMVLGYDPVEHIMPITYMNSAANLKGFVGERGGTVCTSSNARGALEWAFNQREKVFFFPDQHLGRNTGKAMGIPLEEMVLWNPFKPFGGLTDEQIRNAKIILWQGHCSVHQQFRPEHIDMWRRMHPDINIIVHPECAMEVVDKADFTGSTAHILNVINAAPAGSKWAVGTEIHLVNRVKQANPDKMVTLLSPFSCLCSTMYRISPLDLANVLENLVEGRVINQIFVPEDVQRGARLALDRMLSIPK